MKLGKRYKKNVRWLAEQNTDNFVFKKLKEECGELIESIRQFQTAGSKGFNDEFSLSYEHLIEELCDVRIMIDQASWLLDEDGQRRYLDFKLNRELIRKALNNPQWCATNPEKKE